MAVSEAGGLGSIPGALLTPETARAELIAIRSATQAPFNINFFCYDEPTPDAAQDAAWRRALRPYYEEFGVGEEAGPAGPRRSPFNRAMADLLAEFKPPVVRFHFGLPAPDLMAQVKAWSPVVMSSATTVAEARWLEAHGADIVIAQGVEAGGHRGMFLSRDLATQVETLTLVREIAKTVRLPVVAAGGMATAQDVARAMEAGAVAVQVGTAFLRCPEATTTAVHRSALERADGPDTALTNLFTGRPARGVINRLMRDLGPLSSLAPEFPRAAEAVAPIRVRAEALGRNDFSSLWAGMNYRHCRPVAAAVVTRALAGVGNE